MCNKDHYCLVEFQGICEFGECIVRSFNCRSNTYIAMLPVVNLHCIG